MDQSNTSSQMFEEAKQLSEKSKLNIISALEEVDDQTEPRPKSAAARAVMMRYSARNISELDQHRLDRDQQEHEPLLPEKQQLREQQLEQEQQRRLEQRRLKQEQLTPQELDEIQQHLLEQLSQQEQEEIEQELLYQSQRNWLSYCVIL